MNKYYYMTQFLLTYPVNDFDSAVEYLSEDDMTEFLKEHLIGYNNLPYLAKKVAHIAWQLLFNDCGRIVLVTYEKLSEDELAHISKWVSGQNSDGLGEGFEQQSFAEIYDEDNLEDEDCEPWPCAYASFDWRDNDYIFTEVKEKDL